MQEESKNSTVRLCENEFETRGKPKCRYCAKEILSLSSVKVHENNVCKKKSQISEVEEPIDCPLVKTVSKFGYHCQYCGKGFLNSTYVKKHEDNVCKKKSGYTKFIYGKIDDDTDLKSSV